MWLIEQQMAQFDPVPHNNQNSCKVKSFTTKRR